MNPCRGIWIPPRTHTVSLLKCVTFYIDFTTVTRNSIASYYVTMTIGCPLTQKIKVQNVTYGSKAKNCFTDFQEAIAIVQKECPGTSCVVKATDTFFKKNPCKSYSWKMLNITYSCVDSKFVFILLLNPLLTYLFFFLI